MTILVIVESPAKCKKIEGYLGSGYKCKASFGHIRGLSDGLKCIDIGGDFKPTFTMLPGKGKYIKPLRDAVKRATEVVLATDDDREGEAIAWHICKVFKLPVATTKRIVFNEITKAAVKHAMANPRTINMAKVRAQQARQVLDRLVGFTVSPLLWRHISRTSEQSLSAGRCQTPALRLIYDNQRDIDTSPGKLVYDTTGIFDFSTENLAFRLSHDHEGKDCMEEFLVKTVNYSHIFTRTPIKKRSRPPPQPFTTSRLQQVASNELHFSPKQTMKLAQTLYEGGYITYMRTDSTTYSNEFIKAATGYIDGRWGKAYVSPRASKLATRSGGASQEAHEAIRPTKVDRLSVSGIEARAIKLYQLIWANTVESCMASSRYNLLSVSISAPEKRHYTRREELITFPGWQVVRGYDTENPVYTLLLGVEVGSDVEYVKVFSKVAMKDLKQHYTEARLVSLLEKKGIGRPSTFSGLVSKIQGRGYVKKMNVEGKSVSGVDFTLDGDELEEAEISRVFGGEKNKLVIQPTGTIVVEFLIKHMDPMFIYEYTSGMEAELDKISAGTRIWNTLCSECYEEMGKLSSKIGGTHRETVRLDDEHVYMIGRYGPVVKHEVDGKVTFKKVKKGLNMDRLKSGGYSLSDVVDPQPAFSSRRLGSYKNTDVILKKGKYGHYMTHGSTNHSLKALRKATSQITLEDVLPFLMGEKSSNPKVLLMVDGDLSVRSGKFGPYLFYKTKTMKKPRFISLKGTDWRALGKEGISEWARDTHGV